MGRALPDGVRTMVKGEAGANSLEKRLVRAHMPYGGAGYGAAGRGAAGSLCGRRCDVEQKDTNGKPLHLADTDGVC